MTTYTRRDGRATNELRPLNISYDGLARVDGSARFGFGDETSALASISGPIEVRLAAELPSKATFEVIVRPLANIPATEAKFVGTSVKSTLEPSLILTRNPRTLVQLVIQSLTTPKSSLWKDAHTAAMINASTLAFLHAGSVPMKGVVAAVAVGRLADGTLVLDPSEDESQTLRASGGFAFMFSDETHSQQAKCFCVWSNWRTATGYSADELFEAREFAKSGAAAIYDSIRSNVESLEGATEVRPPIIQVKEEEEDGKGSDDDEKMEI